MVDDVRIVCRLRLWTQIRLIHLFRRGERPFQADCLGKHLVDLVECESQFIVAIYEINKCSVLRLHYEYSSYYEEYRDVDEI